MWDVREKRLEREKKQSQEEPRAGKPSAIPLSLARQNSQLQRLAWHGFRSDRNLSDESTFFGCKVQKPRLNELNNNDATVRFPSWKRVSFRHGWIQALKGQCLNCICPGLRTLAGAVPSAWMA